MKPPTVNAIRNLIGGLLVGYGFVSFFCFGILEELWANAAPRQPNAALGITFVHNEHGSYTYFSGFQATAGALMFWTSIPLCFLGMLLAPRKKVNGTAGWYASKFNRDQDDLDVLTKWAALAGAVASPLFLFFVGPYIVRALIVNGFVLNLG
jgi:hypothetical protein